MLRRTLMRRAYNSGRWKRARDLAYRIVNKPNEEKLARSVIIRSYWNEGNYPMVVELNREWDGEFNHLLEKQGAGQKLFGPDGEAILSPKVLQWHSQQPSPSTFDCEFDNSEISNNFYQEGHRVWMRHPHGWTFWDMPEGFQIEKTHRDLLRLVAEVLLYPFNRDSRQVFEKSRQKGTASALSFSAGTDSTAAAMIMPEDAILGYHRRTVDSILDHRNAERLLSHFESKGRVIADIPSNHELIRTYHYKQIGFSTDFACATHLILLSDFYDLGAIAFGMPLDNTYLWKGRKYRDFEKTDYFQYWSKRFADAGLDLLLPIAGISEAGCLLICEKSGIAPLMNSCLRGDGKNGCGQCWKCFHKNGPLGRDFNIMAREIQTFLNRTPLPTATHALWALKEMNLEEATPHLRKLLANDFSWWTKIYPLSDSLHPQDWKPQIKDRLLFYLDPMEEPYALETINLYDE